MTKKSSVYEIRPRKDKRGVDLISDALPFGRLWYGDSNAVSNAINYAKFFSRSHDAVIRVYDEAGNVIQTHEHAGKFGEYLNARLILMRRAVGKPKSNSSREGRHRRGYDWIETCREEGDTSNPAKDRNDHDGDDHREFG